MKQKIVAIALIFFLTFFAHSVSECQWVQTNGLYTENIQALAVSGSNLFAATSDSGVFLSTNNGISWLAINSGMSDSDVLALATDSPYVYAGTSGDGVFRSTNNGTSWAPVDSGLSNTTAMAFLINRTNLFVGTSGGVFSSMDSGTSWKINLSSDYVNAFAAGDTNLFAGGYGGIFLSTNNGVSWTDVNAAFSGGTDALTVMGTNLFAGTIDDGVYLSTNNGSSWANVTNDLVTGVPEVGANSFAVSGANIFAASKGYVWLSTDTGAFWNPVSDWMGSEVVVLALSFEFLYAGTVNNGVWRRPLSDFNQSGVAQNEQQKATSLQIYPNPFSQSTQITFTSQAAGYAEVTIVNMLGVEVARVFSGELSAGEHSFPWNADGTSAPRAPDGMYECLVRFNGQAETLPVVLMR